MPLNPARISSPRERSCSLSSRRWRTEACNEPQSDDPGRQGRDQVAALLTRGAPSTARRTSISLNNPVSLWCPRWAIPPRKLTLSKAFSSRAPISCGRGRCHRTHWRATGGFRSQDGVSAVGQRDRPGRDSLPSRDCRLHDRKGSEYRRREGEGGCRHLQPAEEEDDSRLRLDSSLRRRQMDRQSHRRRSESRIHRTTRGSTKDSHRAPSPVRERPR